MASLRLERAAGRMNPERFRQMEELYDAAAAVDPGQRTRFIEEHCAGDEDLRRELVAAFRDGSSGLTGAVEHAAAELAKTAKTEDSDDSWTGRRMGPYRIARRLGSGGMGTV